jgi:hypothetical protein
VSLGLAARGGDSALPLARQRRRLGRRLRWHLVVADGLLLVSLPLVALAFVALLGRPAGDNLQC